MDGHRFDELTKTLAMGASRRRILKGVVAGVSGAVLSAIGRERIEAAPNRCAQGCAFEPKGPRQAACKQACKKCDGDFSRICFGTEIICCPPETFCCEGPAGTTCCPFGTECCGGQCCDAGTICCFGVAGPQCVADCPEGTFLDPETCECVPFVNCAEFDCGADPCGFNVCGENPETGPCLCALTADGTCSCFQPICVGPECAASADCPEGFACVAECCGPPFCAPLCETPLGATAAGANRWGP